MICGNLDMNGFKLKNIMKK